MPAKSVRLSDTEKRTIGKTDDDKSSAARQAWKKEKEKSSDES
jgi:hypothetical protein